MESAADFNLAYLQAAFNWLDARLEFAIRTWQLAGQNPADRFRGLYVTDSEALSQAKRGVGTRWGSGIALPDKENKQFEQARKSAAQALQDIEAQAGRKNILLRLKELQQIFGLSDFEWWSLVACLAPACDLRYERIYSYLQDDVTRIFAGVDLILFLLSSEGLERVALMQYFEPGSSLRLFRLIQPVEETGKPANRLRQSFQVTPGVVDWLLGTSPAEDGGMAFYPVPAAPAKEIDSIFDRDDIPALKVMQEAAPFICLHGEDAMKQSALALRLSAGLRRPMFALRLNPDDTRNSAIEKLHIAVRNAKMTGALLLVQNMDVLVDEEGCLFADGVSILRLMAGAVLMGSSRPFKFHPGMPGNDYPLMYVSVPRLSSLERAGLWSAQLGASQGVLDDKTLLVLGGQFDLTNGQIVAAASTARSKALQYGRELTADDLFDAARFHSGHHLAELAHKIEPRYEWDDLVLPETPLSMLREMVSMVQSRPLVLETWGLGRKLTAGHGVSALFSGPPGTGKTLAAQIIAHQLGIDLYRIDLSTVVSKYIGETEKNLEKIFSEASESNAILFFDEADTIFGKRSEVKDAHDRYANIEVGYLLQRMENYSGVTILATNLRGNLDEAFTRRLQFIVNFPFPDEEHRLRIWSVLMPPDLPRDDDLDLRIMADRFKLAGGSIRNILVSGAYMAAANGGRLTMAHLLHGARRELQKMERLVQESDFALPS